MILIDQIEQQIEALNSKSLHRTRRHAETPCAPRVTVDGKPMLAFCSNDYLGLASHPKVIAALHAGIDQYGVGSGASHLISGHSRAHAVLEERLAEFLAPHLEHTRALYFCTGYMANLAILSGLAAVSGKGSAGTELFSESLNHASLIDGAKLARAKLQVYPHGDVAILQAMLEQSTEKHDAWLVVDDAHGFGTLGAHGRGILEHYNLSSPNLVYMGTLGKAAGVGGAFVAAHASVIEWLINKARPYIYTTAAPPALAHALLASLEIIQGDEGASRRAHLQALIQQLHRDLKLKKWSLMPSSTAIQPIIIGENAPAMQAAAMLYEQGIWVPAIRPPTVPVGTARLRMTLSAAHTQEDVASLVDAVNRLES
jgi:8-amino-7-oxononanoate synthase